MRSSSLSFVGAVLGEVVLGVALEALHDLAVLANRVLLPAESFTCTSFLMSFILVGEVGVHIGIG